MMLAALLLVTQVAVQDPRLERLDPDTRAAVVAVVDSAHGVGLPVEPIIQRALEGVTKGAAGARIVAAVRRLTVDLGTARTALGTIASEAELEAGVAALRAGATPDVLAKLRDVRRPPLTVALSVLADLVASGVPADSAAAAVLVLAKLRDVRRPPLTVALSVLADLVASGVPADSAAAAVLVLAPKARDADLVEFRRAVERDIALGAPPAAATSVRVNVADVYSATNSGANPNPATRSRRPRP